MFDCVKGNSQSDNRLQPEDGPDKLEKLDHRLSIHVTGLLVLLFVRKYFPLRSA
jgi:hypothetical protein